MIRRFVSDYISELKEVLERIPVEGFEQMVELIMDAYEDGRSIFIMGNGGSGSTASHFACDINKGASFGREKRFRVICLNDNVPTMLAYSNDLSYEDVFAEQLKNFLAPGDVVIGISGSGNSENVLRAVGYARDKGARTIGLVGFDGGRLARLVDVPIVVDVNDMQKVEDIHLVITHMVMQVVCKRLCGR